MENKLWGIKYLDDRPMNVVLFVSRKKDNKSIGLFEERRESFVTHEEPYSAILNQRFKEFVERGREGETSRMYYSVNERDPENVYKSLLHFLIDNPDFNLSAINGKITEIASHVENAKTDHWMFDFDIKDKDKLREFINDIINIAKPAEARIITHESPNGYAVIVEHGFDTRELLSKWKDKVTLKRDDLLCIDWMTKVNFDYEEEE